MATADPVLPLENGMFLVRSDRLTRNTFEYRYRTMLDVKKSELFALQI